jgi:Ubiquitin carboxyl-terminal hydrolase
MRLSDLLLCDLSYVPRAPRYVGLTNLGNSCYMNSVLQLLWTLPELRQRYAAAADAIFRSAPPDSASDFPTQAGPLVLRLRLHCEMHAEPICSPRVRGADICPSA